MRKRQIFFSLAMAVMVSLSVSVAGAQPIDPFHLGEITVEMNPIFQIIDNKMMGSGWEGQADLRFKGKTYPLTLEGFGAEISEFQNIKVKVKGDVYNLQQVPDLIGKYLPIEGDPWAIRGKEGLVVRNDKGVVINFVPYYVSNKKDIKLGIKPDGLSISMK